MKKKITTIITQKNQNFNNPVKKINNSVTQIRIKASI